MVNACQWEPIDRFQSLPDYEKHLSWLNQQVAEGGASEVPLDPEKAWGNAWDEHWYRCVADGEVWRLVGPDPPFRGVFKRLDSTPRESDGTGG